jgi:hypothetical protein
MVDVGGSCGALIVVAPESLLGVEIEIRPVDHPWTGTHTAVRRRELRDSVTFAGLFGSLPEGEYELRVIGSGDGSPDGPGALSATVTAGAVGQVRWPLRPASA